MKKRGTELFCLLIFLGLIMCLALSSGFSSPLSVGEENYYALKVGGKITGYSTYKVREKKDYQEESVWVCKEKTLLKFVMSDKKTKTMEYETITYLNSNLTPRYYQLNFSQDTIKQELQTTFSQGQAHITLKTGEKIMKQDIPISGDTYLIDGNVFTHYIYLFKSLKLIPGEEKKISLLVPQAMKVFSVNLKVKEEKEKVTLGGREWESLVAVMKGDIFPEMIFWINSKGELLRLSLPSQNFTMELSNEKVISQIAAVDIFKLLENKFTSSNVSFTYFGNVSQMKAEIEVKATGEKIDPAFLTYNNQIFTGTVKDNLIKGVIETKVECYKGENSPSFPFETEPELLEYLQAEEKIESNNAEIIAKAKEITRKSKDAWEAAVAIADWVYKNIRYEITGAGAKETLKKRRGDCGPHTLLTIALCRAAGIPARMVGGFMYAQGKFGQHYWVEVYMDKEGWIPLDPTTGEYGYLDATHVRLWQKGEIESISVRVIDYTDEGEGKKISVKKLTLIPGERRRYSFVIQGKEVGYNEYEVVTSKKREGILTYQLKSHLELKLQVNQVIDDEFYVDEKANPLHYKLNALVNNQSQSVDCAFTQDKVHTLIKAGEKVLLEKDTDLKAKTFLLSNNMVGWFDILYKVLPLEPGKTLPVPCYVINNASLITLRLSISKEMEEIEVGETTYKAFVCEVSPLGETHYITSQGDLVRIVLPYQQGVIDWVQSKK